LLSSQGNDNDNETTTKGIPMVTLATVNLGEAGFAGLTAVVDKLNRRADRHGMNKLVVTVKAEYNETNKDTGAVELWRRVEIEGCAPCINGWYLAARIENNDIIGNVVRVVPGKFADNDYSEYREHDFSCDHCNTRRRRNDVFVLADDNGNRKVVGRNCLADFLRTEDAGAFAEYAEWFDKLSGMSPDDYNDLAYDEGFGGREGRPACKLRTYLAAARVCERRIGWCSRTEAYNDPGRTATADDAYFLLYGRGEAHKRFVDGYELFISDDDYDYAENAIAWAQSIPSEKTAKSEYLDTIQKIATAGMVDASLAGFAASIGRAHDKEKAWAAEREEKEGQRKEKDFIGNTGERLRDQVVTVKGIHYFEGNYGLTTIVRMEATLSDTTVAPITWFASGEKDFEEGAEYKLTGTIKKHDTHDRYGRQTLVNRCKLVQV
jgi:hypothetical protein